MILYLLLAILIFILFMEWLMVTPPNRDVEWTKFLYMGIPGWITSKDDSCPEVAGPASWVMDMNFNGYLFCYRGSYLRALWYWSVSPSIGNRDG